MLSDGLTKGSVDRSLIDAALDGRWDVQHTPKEWQSAKAIRLASTTAELQTATPT